MDLIKIKNFQYWKTSEEKESPNYKPGEKCANTVLTNGLVSGYLKNLWVHEKILNIIDLQRSAN